MRPDPVAPGFAISSRAYVVATFIVSSGQLPKFSSAVALVRGGGGEEHQAPADHLAESDPHSQWVVSWTSEERLLNYGGGISAASHAPEVVP